MAPLSMRRNVITPAVPSSMARKCTRSAVKSIGVKATPRNAPLPSRTGMATFIEDRPE
jgi:hypothetical protein